MDMIVTRRRFSVWPLALAFNAILLAVCVFVVTQEVKRREAEVTELNKNILAEQQTMRVLDAEWAYLTRPQRLEELIEMKLTGRASDDMKAEEPATIEPAAGKVVAVQPAPKAEAAVVKSAQVEPRQKPIVQKVSVKTEKPKAKTVAPVRAAKAEKDIVWPIKQQRVPQAASVQRPHVGVARPIVE